MRDNYVTQWDEAACLTDAFEYQTIIKVFVTDD